MTDYRHDVARPEGEGFAAFEGEPGKHLLNPMGGVHGGRALTPIDSVAGCAGHRAEARMLGPNGKVPARGTPTILVLNGAR